MNAAPIVVGVGKIRIEGHRLRIVSDGQIVLF
jgi:hypothetical protein